MGWSKMCNDFEVKGERIENNLIIYPRKEIAEAAFAKKTSQAAMYLGFKSGDGNEDKSDGMPLFKDGPVSRGDSEKGRTFLFASDSLREEWRAALQSSLKQLEPYRAGR